MTTAKRKELGRDDKSLADSVTHGEMEAELRRLRAAITLLASRLGNELGTTDAGRLLDLLAPPHERLKET